MGALEQQHQIGGGREADFLTGLRHQIAEGNARLSVIQLLMARNNWSSIAGTLVDQQLIQHL